ncbi:hypothetical protein M9H77_00632 [Catharanthus roseus]|nr:hypothetical protein M9H77_00632 [Catharanthus roseus]
MRYTCSIATVGCKRLCDNLFDSKLQEIMRDRKNLCLRFESVAETEAEAVRHCLLLTCGSISENTPTQLLHRPNCSAKLQKGTTTNRYPHRFSWFSLRFRHENPRQRLIPRVSEDIQGEANLEPTFYGCWNVFLDIICLPIMKSASWSCIEE